MICKCDKGVIMDEKVYKYRKRHPCCNYCKYLKLEVPPVYCVSSYYNCEAKDKIIYFIYMRRICSCYEVKKGNEQ